MQSNNINSTEYWEHRFSTGDWEAKGGFSQTRAFARSQIPLYGLSPEFSGTLTDFGCGAGDAFPLYRLSFPRADLIGVDFSASAIDLCRKRYSGIARFINGRLEDVPNSDVIVASNVLEHLSNDVAAVELLRCRSQLLLVIVPYKEDPLCSEHVRSYDEDSFRSLGDYSCTIFDSEGWTEMRWGLAKLVLKNIFRLLVGRPLRKKRRQIIYRFAH